MQQWSDPLHCSRCKEEIGEAPLPRLFLEQPRIQLAQASGHGLVAELVGKAFASLRTP